MRLSILKFMGLIFVPALLSSCATTSLVDTWRNPDMTMLKHHKLLLVYISKSDNTSRLYEDVLASELNRRGVVSVSGYTLMPEGKRVNRQILTKGVEQSGADAVITMQLSESNSGQPSSQAMKKFIRTTGTPAHFQGGTCTATLTGTAIMSRHRPDIRSGQRRFRQ